MEDIGNGWIAGKYETQQRQEEKLRDRAIETITPLLIEAQAELMRQRWTNLKHYDKIIQDIEVAIDLLVGQKSV